MPLTVLTIGHSTRALDDFVALLDAHCVVQLADVRTHPGSRRHPQYGATALAQALAAHRIDYRHFAALGGRRSPAVDSPNGGWQNGSFRGYADHMATEAFTDALEELIAWSATAPTAIMCAEAIWWRCHRRLIADVLVARGIEVRHILSLERAAPHELTPFALVEGERVTYPGLLGLLGAGESSDS
jgi:uncharacterized protein (DUF488 family)